MVSTSRPSLPSRRHQNLQLDQQLCFALYSATHAMTRSYKQVLAASKSGKPVLLRLDYASGHGIGSTKAQVLDERADHFAFVLWQMGVPGYELKPAL